MRRYLLYILITALFLLSGCTDQVPEEFNAETEGIVEVILRDYNDGTIHYDCVGPDGKRQESDEFTDDPTEIFYADTECFEWIDEENAGINHLVGISLTDSAGNPAASTPVIDRIFEKATSLPREILKLYILRQDEYHFVVAELNQTAFVPCKLYYFDPSADQLIELYSYDATEIIGIRIRNPENIPG